MTQVSGHSVRHFAAALLVLLVTALALGQWQVNHQIGQVNRRVGGELYGNNTNMGSVRYAAQSRTTLLPSEARYATWRSGALPSEIAMNAAAVGPLAPNGAISYVPAQSTLQAAMKLPAPQLYATNYNFAQPAKSDQFLAPQPGFAASSIRYASPAPASPPPNLSTGQVPPRTLPNSTLKLQPSYAETFGGGSIRYADPPKP